MPSPRASQHNHGHDHASSPSSFSYASSSARLAAPLVSACCHLLQPNGSISGNAVAESILPNFPDLCSALPAEYDSSHFTNRQALLGTQEARRPLTHGRIRDFILKELGPQLHEMGYGRGHRIALVLPNGPELALAILGIAHWASCLPLNANGATSELKKDLQAAQAAMVVGLLDDYSSAAVQDMARALQIPFCGLAPSSTEVGVFRLIPRHTPTPTQLVGLPSLLRGSHSSDELCCATYTCSFNGNERHTQYGLHHRESSNILLSNDHDDEVLVLFTSGTTGNKKLVAHHLGDMLIAAACIAVSWNLSPEDVNCNLMPLFHVGGIVRQIFAPILSAGSVICCPSFDPQLFWNLLLPKDKDDADTSSAFTWYYAAPTMHQVILGTMPNNNNVRPQLRMIANAAGGLLPSLAQELRQVFGANVLPSYGMTECMPISSPPHNYTLHKPGTSGVAVGPEITVFNADFEQLKPGKEGNICIRGRPCFHGYGRTSNGNGNKHTDPSKSFLEGGWFNTGDLGYLDEDGYLYITGRSKEVINRGGEIISPMEVEEEVLQHPSVKTCLAFSASHDVLQEIVGMVLVCYPEMPKPDLPTLHNFLQERLATAKWPQCLVYMDALPKSHTNKLIRAKLGHRLHLPSFNDQMAPVIRTFEATCPPQGTPVGVSIPCENVFLNTDYVQEVLQDELGVLDIKEDDGYVKIEQQEPENPTILDFGDEPSPKPKQKQLLITSHPTKMGGIIAHVWNIDRIVVVHKAKQCLDSYLQPSHIIRYFSPISKETIKKMPEHNDAVGFITAGNSSSVLTDPTIISLQEMIQEMIDLDCLPSPDTSFFHMGGSSLLASQLASRIRKRFDCSFSGADIFRHNTCITMAKKIQAQTPHLKAQNASNMINKRGRTSLLDSTGSMNTESNGSKECSVDLQGAPMECIRLEPQNGLFSAIFQLIPLVGLFPVWQFSRFFLFFMSLLKVLHKLPGEGNYLKFVLTLVVFHALWVTLTPLIFVLLKWVVIGRYQKGRYALWSSYYLRWWLVDVCRKMFGNGIWGHHNDTLVLYYRLLGAKIGRNVQISLLAEVAEYDLVTIGNNAVIEYSDVRGFGVDNGAMILGPITVGNNASVGIRSVVAPFTKVPDGAHVGPGTSSYEISHDDDRHLHYNRYASPEPNFWMQFFVGRPIVFIVDTLSHVPAMCILYLLVTMHHRQNDGFHTIGDLMEWLLEPRRLPYFFGIRLVRATVAPFVYMAFAILIKWLVIGKFEPGPRDTKSQWQLMRHWLVAKLFSRENMQEVTELLGRHYEAVSTLYRLLGAKVGKRVFWPGHQPLFTGEFDLLEIGDDVVFGSRTVIIATTTETCEKVVFCAGANISDNTVVLPGSSIGKNAVLGSNTVCPPGRYLPESSIWLGSKGGEPIVLESGVEVDDDSSDEEAVMMANHVKPKDLPMVGDESTLRPFGRAVGFRQAPFFVWPGFMMSFYNIVCNALFATFHALPLISSLHISGCILYGFPISDRDYDGTYFSPLQLFCSNLIVFIATHCVRVIICFVVEIAAKWIYMGRRHEGRYNW